MTVPDLSDRVALVTGGNSGIGKETAVLLARAGATLLVASRDGNRGSVAAEQIRQRARTDKVHVVVLDLASFRSIRHAVSQVLAGWGTLDVLVNNAAVMVAPRQATAEGFEMTFGVNHLGHFLLTTLLLDRLAASAPSRIVNVSSVGHRFLRRGLDLDDLQNERDYSATDAYNASKLASILFTKELARRLTGTGVSAFAVHPGAVRTRLGADGDTKGGLALGMGLFHRLSGSAVAGAGVVAYAATEPGIESQSGGYFRRAVVRRSNIEEAAPSRAARDMGTARRLWKVSEALIAGCS